MVGANTFRNPGHDGQARDDARPHQRAAGRSSASAAPGSSASTMRSGSTSGPGFGERLDRLDESVVLIRRLLDGERFDHEGRFYQLHDALLRAAARSRPTCRSSSAAPDRRRRSGRWPAAATPGTRPGTVDEVAARDRDPARALRRRRPRPRRDRADDQLPDRHPRRRVRRPRPPTTRLLAHNGDAATRVNVPVAPRPAGRDRRRRIAPYRDLGFGTVIVRLPAPYDGETIERIGEVAGLASATRARVSDVGRGPSSLLAGGVGGAKLAHGAPGRIVGDRADGRRQHRRRPRAPRPARHARPRHRHVHAGRARRPGAAAGASRARRSRRPSMLERYGEETWFRLGDRDLATHIVRTARLRRGEPADGGRRELQRALGVAATILPMTDEPVRTEVRTDDGWLEFQDYFVRRHQEPDGPRGPLPRDRRRRGRRPRSRAALERGRRRRHRAVEPDRLGRADPRRARHARGTRPARAGARRPDRRGVRDRRRQGAQGPGRPDARVARPRGERARRRPARYAGARRRLRPRHGRRRPRAGDRGARPPDRSSPTRS